MRRNCIYDPLRWVINGPHLSPLYLTLAALRAMNMSHMVALGLDQPYKKAKLWEILSFRSFSILENEKDFCIYLCSLWVLSTLYFYMSFLYANTPWVNHRLNRSREISLTDVFINFVYGLLPNLRKEKLSKWSQSQRWVLHQPIYLQHFRLIDRVDICRDWRLRNFIK